MPRILLCIARCGDFDTAPSEAAVLAKLRYSADQILTRGHDDPLGKCSIAIQHEYQIHALCKILTPLSEHTTSLHRQAFSYPKAAWIKIWHAGSYDRSARSL